MRLMLVSLITGNHSATPAEAFETPTSKIPKTLRVHYGLEGMKYIIQMYKGEVNGDGEKERLPTEYQNEFEQEMLKHIHDLKNEL